MAGFVVGQRWTSAMEPELGLGIVDAIDGRQIHVRFPESGITRIYAAASAPLQRVVFHPGDRVTAGDGTAITIAAVETQDGLNLYCGEGVRLSEDRLSTTLTVSRPNARLMAGHRDPTRLFDLRVNWLAQRLKTVQSPVHGFVGGRVALIAHQFAIAAEVSSRRFPRVLLADETGLGKTIEAGLILHRLTTLGRVARALVIVPDALVVQWYVELARRFNLRFRILDEAFSTQAVPPDEGWLEDEPLILCGFALLADASGGLKERLTAGGWDLVVVDEAHRLQPGDRCFRQVRQLAEQVPGLILITATPGQLSARGHFARLQLLEPHRYPDYSQFKRETNDFEAVARLAQAILDGNGQDAATVDALTGQLAMTPAAARRVLMRSGSAGDAARRRLVRRLIDHRGTSRMMFRTRRRSIAAFPGRQVTLIPIDPCGDREGTCAHLNREFLQDCGLAPPSPAVSLDGDCRVAWLTAFMRDRRREKTLLICRTPQKVNALIQALEKQIRFRIGRFHEDMTLVQRDRNAAWFADPDGADLLICSEIGSEGRNFQFARHLVLFDLPMDAELLEQRIGRLDRIGQTGVVRVVVPYVVGTAGEVMARWYHEALNALARHAPAAAWVTQRLMSALTARINDAGWATSGERLDRLIHAGRVAAVRQERRIDSGRDRLLEMDGFSEPKADHLLEAIRQADGDAAFPSLVEGLLDVWGITMEDISPGIHRLTPDHRYAQALPGFRPSGLTVTMDRAIALAREDIDFLTWDHPLVMGAMDLLLGSGQGSVAFVHLKRSAPPLLLLEMVFVLEAVGHPGLDLERFLPPTPLRVVVDGDANEAADHFPEGLSEQLDDGSADLFATVLAAISRRIPKMIDAGQGLARRRAQTIIEDACRSAVQTMDDAVDRLDALNQTRAACGDAKIETVRQERHAVLSAIGAARVRLDALRLIVAGNTV